MALEPSSLLAMLEPTGLRVNRLSLNAAKASSNPILLLRMRKSTPFNSKLVMPKSAS